MISFSKSGLLKLACLMKKGVWQMFSFGYSYHITYCQKLSQYAAPAVREGAKMEKFTSSKLQ
jgi:hypothetical protein